jgi:hypothetical protein
VLPGLVRKTVVAAVIGALAIGLAACQSPAPTAAPPAATATVRPVATGQGGAIPASAFTGQRPFTGPAAARYGQPALQAAYQEMVNFAFGAGWNPALITKNDAVLARADFGYVRAYLTPAFRAKVDATLAKVVLGDRSAIRELEQAVFFGVTGPGGLLPPVQGTIVTDRRFTPASVGVDGSGAAAALRMSFAAKATIQLRNRAGQSYDLPTGRTVSYRLVPNTGPASRTRPFLIDSWTVSMKVGRPQQSR